MINDVFAGMVFLYAFIALPFVVISGLYEAGEDDEYDSMTEWA